MKFCQLAVCPFYDDWSEWGGCSVTCGRGTCERTRKCIKNDPLPGAVLPSEDELDDSESRAEDATDANRRGESFRIKFLTFIYIFSFILTNVVRKYQ